MHVLIISPWAWYVVSLRYYRGVEQWSARYFDLVEVGDSNSSPATIKLYTKYHDYGNFDSFNKTEVF